MTQVQIPAVEPSLSCFIVRLQQRPIGLPSGQQQLWTCFFRSLLVLPVNQLQTDSCNTGNTVWSKDTRLHLQLTTTTMRLKLTFSSYSFNLPLVFLFNLFKFSIKKYLKCVLYSRESFDLISLVHYDIVS